MTAELGPFGEHDNVEQAELDDIVKKNRIWVESNHQEDATILQTEIAKRIHSLGAVRSDKGWAIFTTEVFDPGGGATTLNDRKETLVMLRLDPADTSISPMVRLITNEEHVLNGKTYYISEDVTIDMFQSCYYHFDGLTPEECEGQEAVNGSTPIFVVEGERLKFYNSSLTTPTENFQVVHDDKMHVVTPFGRRVDIEDQRYALARARALFEEIRGVTPDYALGWHKSGEL